MRYLVSISKVNEVRDNSRSANQENAISLRSISKRYYRDVPLLEEISLEIDYGEIAILIGPSGSGKSTVVQMCAGLILPDSGTATIDGIQIFSEPQRSGKKNYGDRSKIRQSLISYVPQDDYLLETLNVFDNVALALDLRTDVKDRDTKVTQSLRDVGIEHLKDREIYKISAGERRRCAIARGLVRNPKIFIADEPTSSLDAEKTNDLMTLLRKKLNPENGTSEEKMAVLIASHDVAEIEPFADKIYEIRNHTLIDRPKTVDQPIKEQKNHPNFNGV